MPEASIKEGGTPQSSPYVLKIERKTGVAPKKCVDIVLPEKKRAKKIKMPKRENLFAKSEVLRMATIATLVVMILNMGQMYFKAGETKDAIFDAAYAGVDQLMEIDTDDMEGANEAFQIANYQFEMAENMLWYLNDSGNIEGANKYIKTADGILNAAVAITTAGELFAEFVVNTTELSEGLFTDNTEGVKPSLTEALKAGYSEYLEPAYDELVLAQTHLDNVDVTVLPAAYVKQVALAQEQLKVVNNMLGKVSENFNAIIKLLGDELPQKYMILFENNSELRPGGGFMGSFLLVDINDGYIDSMEFSDIYEWDGAFTEFIEPPVKEIEYLTCCWGLRDANYSPDFVVSSEAVRWLFEKENGPSVDHVIMVDLSLVSDIINKIGPLESPSLEGQLTGENFELILSYIVESKLMGETSPKSIVEEIVPIFKEEILKPQNLLSVAGAFMRGAEGKHFAAYSVDEEMQNFWRSWNLDGELYRPGENEDYLLVTVSGIGGNKTDRYVEQEILHQTLISREGELMNKLTITREHTWTEEVRTWQMDQLNLFGFETVSETVQDILGQGDNVAGIRVYVPNGSSIIDTDGIFEHIPEVLYDEQLEMEYFYFVVRTKPGETTEIQLTYDLPFNLTFEPADDYFLFVEKQPGLDNTVFTKEIIAPAINNHALYPKGEFQKDQDLNYTLTLDLDKPIHLGGVFTN